MVSLKAFSLLFLLVFTIGCGRSSEFANNVDPLAIASIRNGAISEQATIEYWEKTYLQACKAYVEMSAFSGKKVEPFTDKECLSLMYKHRPDVKELNK